ncbi:hypothetical protein KO02_05980 [Sphingobacterium sp. ML3W]|nr:hypothetical protein KO02_05980 [Sphingobacterium sp. ML3W]
MKLYAFCLFMAGTIFVLSSCQSTEAKKTEKQSIKQDGHDHAEHDHSHEGHEGHDHEGHNHSHDDGEKVAKDNHTGHDHSSEEGHSDGEIIFTEAQAKTAQLKTEVIELRDFHRVIRTSGQIENAVGDDVTVVATTNGVVSFSKSNFTAGSAIKSGENLLAISSKNLLEGDPTNKASAEYESAKNEWERAQSLIEDQLISQKNYQDAKLRFENAKTTFNALSANRSSNGVLVKAPIAGFVKNKLIQDGDYVTVGQPIATITKNKKLQLRADVAEKYFSDMHSIKTAYFRTSYDNKTLKLEQLNGRLVSYGKGIEKNSFYIPMLFEFDNVGTVLPGAYVDISLIAHPIPQALTVPVSALTEDQGVYFIYLKKGKEVFSRQEVKIGHSDGERVLITSGLNKGEEIVTNGVYQVKIAANASLIPEGHVH